MMPYHCGGEIQRLQVQNIQCITSGFRRSPILLPVLPEQRIHNAAVTCQGKQYESFVLGS